MNWFVGRNPRGCLGFYELCRRTKSLLLGDPPKCHIRLLINLELAIAKLAEYLSWGRCELCYTRCCSASDIYTHDSAPKCNRVNVLTCQTISCSDFSGKIQFTSLSGGSAHLLRSRSFGLIGGRVVDYSLWFYHSHKALLTIITGVWILHLGNPARMSNLMASFAPSVRTFHLPLVHTQQARNCSKAEQPT